MGIFSKRGVGLDVGSGVVRTLVLEGTGQSPRITGVGAVALNSGDGSAVAQAVHASLAEAGIGDGPVVTAVGGPDVVVRQLTLPALPANRVIPVLELQHREFGLLPSSEGLLDVQILRRSKADCTVLAVSVPRALIETRQRLLEQAAVKLSILDVDALALLNSAFHLSQPDAKELLVVLHVEEERSLLCLQSERGPVVVRYLDVGASALVDRLRRAGLQTPSERVGAKEADGFQAADACRDVVRRIAEGVRMSLAFYRSEYDRDGLPRYMLSGWLRIQQLNRWLTEELRLDSPFAVLDPFGAVRMTASSTNVDDSAGPEFVQAFGLALRGL